MFSKSTILAFAASLLAANASREQIANYEPYSEVTDHNALDLDQEEMEVQLAIGNDEAFFNAQQIYIDGGHSKSVAQVRLTAPLQVNVLKGTEMLGNTPSGNQVKLLAYDDNVAGSQYMKIQYMPSESQKNYVLCRVGASLDPMTKGCLANTGVVIIDPEGDAIEIGYEYDLTKDNVNKRTIQRFSTGAKKRMYDCDDCPQNYFKQFYDYYGEFDYGNQIVMAAFDGGATNLRNFNSDFSMYKYDGREQIIKKGTAFMIVWMYIVYNLEDAVADCESKCTLQTCNDDIGAHSWDMAVAFYTGMLEGDNGQGSGKFPYALADKRCGNFNTCGENGNRVSGTSKVNLEINRNFKSGLAKFLQGDCEAVKGHKDVIINLMKIPLIQGTLRYAWKTDNEAYSEKAEAEGAIFAMSIAPMVATCNAAAGQVLEDNLQVGQNGSANFKEVKAALESVYDCLGVDPCMVGGLWDQASQSYLMDAEPPKECKGGPSAAPSNTASVGVATLAAALAFVL